MRRAAVLSFALPGAIMACLSLILGTALSPPTALEGVRDRPIQVALVDAGTCVEAPTQPYGAPGLAGRAVICDDDQGVRATVEIIGLPPGAEYTAWWLDVGALPTVCRATLCRQVSTPGDDPTASTQRVGTASVQPTGVLELAGQLRDVHLLHDSQVVVQILGERGRGGPHAQASFAVP
jgi:hypothetical protein